MRHLTIDNLGPINGHFQMNLDPKLSILIGEQATGKSTIARIVHYCLMYVGHEISDGLGCEPKPDITHFEAMQQYLRKNYDSGDVLFSEGNYEFRFNAKDGFVPKSNEDILSALNTFEGASALYIPAGRSMIPLLFESYAAAKNIRVDPFFDQYLLFLDGLRKDSLVSMYDLLDNALKYSALPVNEDTTKAAIILMENILKGRYHNENGEVRIIYDRKASVPLISASSGQQEIIYILLSLLFVLLNPMDFTIVIEEPEAHIYPAAQKLFIELLAHVINATNSRVIITTHSPYILTATNLLIHSAKVENRIKDKKSIVSPMARIEPHNVNAILLERNGKFSYRSIIDKKTGLISAEEIDTVSEVIEKGMSDLVDLEVKHGL